jgi:hypothetical protein
MGHGRSFNCLWCLPFLQQAATAMLSIAAIVAVVQTVMFVLCGMKSRSTGGGDLPAVIASVFCFICGLIGEAVGGAYIGPSSGLVVSTTLNLIYTNAYAMGFGAVSVCVSACLAALAVVLMISKPTVGSVDPKAAGHAYAVTGAAPAAPVTVPAAAVVAVPAAPVAAAAQAV